MAQLRLYGFRLSPFVEKVYRGLQLKGLPFELVEPASPLELRRKNPQTSKMPTLDVDGQQLYDSTLILRELDRRFPVPALVSKDERVAAAQRQLEDWSDESLYWHLMALRWCERNVGATLDQITLDMPKWLRPLARLLAPRAIGRMPVVQGTGRLPYDVIVEQTGRLLDDLILLLDDRAFFYSDRPTVADLAVYGELRSAQSGPTPELEAMIGDRPPLVDHMKRVEEACERGSVS